MLQLDKETFEKVPLAGDKHGTVRVAGTRVTLESLVALFDHGATAEQIAHSFPGLKLDDIYAVITYCLRHEGHVRQYLDEQEQHSDEVRQRLDAEFPDRGIRERLLKKKRESQQSGS